GHHIIGHALHYMKHVEAARKTVRMATQMEFDLRRARRGIRALENFAKQGGAVGTKGAAKLAKAREALQAMQAEYNEFKAVVRDSHKVLRLFKTITSETKGAAMAKLGQPAARLETALAGSRLGRGLLATGRFTASTNF